MLRDHLEASELGITATLNSMFERYQAVIELDAIRLTRKEQAALKEMLMGVFIDDVIAVQAIAQDVIDETECESLRDKLLGATYGQCLATLVRYDLIQ